MSAPVIYGKKVSPEDVLYLSRMEICQILQELAESRSSISAEIGASWTFVSHVLLVDSHEDRLIISYCANKLLNSKVLELPSLKFTTSYHDAYLVFETSSPVETQFDRKPALQYAIPKALTYCHRREHPRIRIPPEISLRCVADAAGVIPFESRITDISENGLGILHYEPDIRLEPGEVLKGCRIIIPGGKPLVADLMVRHVSRIHLEDGTPACRAGLRFLQKTDEIAELVNFFVQKLDKK